MGLVLVRRTTQNRLLTIFGILLLAGFLHGNVAIQVLHDVSQFHRPSSEENPEENSEDGIPGSDGDEIAAPCPVCSSVLARALPTEIDVAIPTLDVPAVDPRPVSGSRWASLRGKVTDTGGVPLASVRVYINAVERCTLTGVDGTWLLRNLPPRTINGAFERLGYGTSVVRVDLGRDAHPSLGVQLEILPFESGAQAVRQGMRTAADRRIPSLACGAADGCNMATSTVWRFIR